MPREDCVHYHGQHTNRKEKEAAQLNRKCRDPGMGLTDFGRSLPLFPLRLPNLASKVFTGESDFSGESLCEHKLLITRASL